MTLDFGLEIEFLVPSTNAGQPMDQARIAAAITAAGVPCHAAGYNHHLSRQWKVVSDGSLMPGRGRTGFELVSPPLDENGLEQVTKVCEVLGALDATVNRSCGLHVHIGARSFPVAVHKKLLELYVTYEPVIDSLMPASRRLSNNHFCQSMTHVQADALAQATTLEQVNNLISRGRYAKVNFSAYWRHGTVEFRHHSGTVQADKIIKWIVLTNALVATAKKEASGPTTLAAALNTLPAAPGTDFRTHPWWRRGHARRIALTMLTRPEGVTSHELRSALMIQSTPSVRFYLAAVGAPTTPIGRRGGLDVFRLPEPAPVVVNTPAAPAPAAPITLDGFTTRLELGPEDKAYWAARAASFTPGGQDREQLAQARAVLAHTEPTPEDHGRSYERERIGSYEVTGVVTGRSPARVFVDDLEVAQVTPMESPNPDEWAELSFTLDGQVIRARGR